MWIHMYSEIIFLFHGRCEIKNSAEEEETQLVEAKKKVPNELDAPAVTIWGMAVILKTVTVLEAVYGPQVHLKPVVIPACPLNRMHCQLCQLQLRWSVCMVLVHDITPAEVVHNLY